MDDLAPGRTLSGHGGMLLCGPRLVRCTPEWPHPPAWGPFLSLGSAGSLP